MKKKLSIDELEDILNKEEDFPIQIIPDGSIRRPKLSKSKKITKPLTYKENLGGEYGCAA